VSGAGASNEIWLLTKTTPSSVNPQRLSQESSAQGSWIATASLKTCQGMSDFFICLPDGSLELGKVKAIKHFTEKGAVVPLNTQLPHFTSENLT